MLGSRPVLLLLGTSSLCAGWSLRAAPRAPSGLQAASPALRLRVAVAPHLNEEDDGTGEGKRGAQVDLVDRAGDPFRVVRLVLYGVFGVVGLVGVVVAAGQLGDDPGSAFTNMGINGAVLAGGIGAYVFDTRVQGDLKEKARPPCRSRHSTPAMPHEATPRLRSRRARSSTTRT